MLVRVEDRADGLADLVEHLIDVEVLCHRVAVHDIPPLTLMGEEISG